MAGDLVVVADRGGPAADGAGLTAAVGEPGQVGGDDAPVCWQGCGAPETHQAAKSRQSLGIGRPGRRRLLRLGVGDGEIDLGRGQDAGRPSVAAAPRRGGSGHARAVSGGVEGQLSALGVFAVRHWSMKCICSQRLARKCTVAPLPYVRACPEATRSCRSCYALIRLRDAVRALGVPFTQAVEEGLDLWLARAKRRKAQA